MTIQIYTDGSCSPNPGKGGYAAVLVWKNAIKTITGSREHTTNNRMELLACIRALQCLKTGQNAHILTDSGYIWLSLHQGWIYGFSSLKQGHFGHVANKDLFDKLIYQLGRHKVTWTWIKGHKKNKNPVWNYYNDMADKLAKEARQ